MRKTNRQDDVDIERLFADAAHSDAASLNTDTLCPSGERVAAVSALVWQTHAHTHTFEPKYDRVLNDLRTPSQSSSVSHPSLPCMTSRRNLSVVRRPGRRV